jgi:methylenetetrahydrofolate dehydrogenase (NADP+)/methenyltetrahydrofolate cyclohydrolase
MNIDGKLIAQEIKSELKEKKKQVGGKLSLAIIVAKETPQIRQFVDYKVQFGREINVGVDVIQLSALEQNNEGLLEQMLHASRTYDGIIVQLPVPPEYKIESILSLYPLSHDVDVIGNTAYQQYKEGYLPFFPPVIGACEEIAERNSIVFKEKEVVVIGEGRLVGAPAAVWAEGRGGIVTVVTKQTENLIEKTQKADIIISGTGVPSLLQPNMIKEGVAIFDAGSGEMAGVIKGDADPACAEKAAFFTPTPGGIGPITVAKVFENLFALYEIRHKKKK